MQIGMLFIVGCVLAFGAAWLCHRQESDPSLRGDSRFAMVLTAIPLALALILWGPTVSASFPVGNPCYGITDGFWYWFLGCWMQ